MKYRPEIDGLRAVAVLPVIAYHAGLPGFSGGFVGVDVFFVISGYLITGILAGDLAAGRFSVARFYERRARRILPALFVVLALSAVAAQLLLMPPAFRDFSASVFAVVLFLSNMLFISEVDYFAPAAENTPLLHTWSLAVEEQFYILFPLILWLLWRIGRGRALAWGVLAVTLASLVFSEWAWRSNPAASFYFLPSRAWELGAGALCALVPLRPRAGARQVLGLAGLAAIAVAVGFYDRSVPFPSLWALLPVGGAVALILAEGGAAGRLLSLRPMVAIGLISYSAYLWHYPLFVFVRLAWGGDPGVLAMSGLGLLSLGLAALSWRYVERPFRGGGALPRRRQVFFASALGIALFAGFGLWGYGTDGRAAMWLAGATPEERQTYALFAPAHAVRRFSDDGDCRFNQRRVTDEARARLADCAARFGPGLAIIGDSHAIDLADSLIDARAAPFIFGMTQGNCRPDMTRNQCDYTGFAALLDEDGRLFSRVIFEVAGQNLIEGPGGRRTKRVFELYPPGTPIPARDISLLDARIARNAAYLAGLARHVPVIWLTPRIEPHLNDSYVMARGCSADFALRPGQAALFQRMAEAIGAAVAGLPGVSALNQPDLLHFTMPRDFITCEALHWADGDHLSPSGRLWLGERLAGVLTR